MIKITCSKDLYTYNAYHLTRAFFPETNASVTTDPAQKEAVIFDIDGRHAAVSGDDPGNPVDKGIYLTLSSITGKRLPWGMLTGVRPTKPAMNKLKEGFSRDDFIKWYGEEKFVSREKAGSAYDIAKTELEILEAAEPEGKWQDTCSIYAGIPFCPSICSYCSFSLGRISDHEDKVDAYVDALVRELAGTAEICRNKRISTVYIGGGTPTSLSPFQLERLLLAVNRFFPSAELSEFTVEAGRPDSITKEKLEVIKAGGVSRISINPQTMQQKTLDAVGREHSVREVYEAFDAAREAGFDNINMDLIAGLPGETAADMEDTLDKVLALQPESLTVHALAIKRRAAMESQYVPGEEIYRMIDAAAQAASDAGLHPYYLYRQKSIAGNFENVGYAKTGKEGLYNILAMEEVQSIFAVGAGTDTKVVLEQPVPNPSRRGKTGRILRCSNVKSINGYINDVEGMLERKKCICSAGPAAKNF